MTRHQQRTSLTAGTFLLVIALAAAATGTALWIRDLRFPGDTGRCIDKPGFAVGSSLVGAPQAEQDARLDRIKDLGVQRIRLDIPWKTLQPRRPRGNDDGWDQSAVRAVDQTLEAARARGIEVMGILAYAPEWAHAPIPKRVQAQHSLPDDPRAMEAFARDAASRWKGTIESWEIWNEPNLLNFGNNASPAKYAELVRVVAAAVRSVDAEAPIVAGALAPATTKEGNTDPIQFTTEMVRAGLGSDVTALSVHPYSYPEPPQLSSPRDILPVSQGFSLVPRVREAAAEQGLVLPIWATEFGAPTGTTKASSGTVSVSEDEQAQWLRQAASQLADTGYAERLYVYSDTDDDSIRPDSSGLPSAEAHFGVFTADGQPKPAAQAMRDIACSA